MAWAAPVHEVVASFDIPPQMPGYGALVAGGDGFHWGTTQGGGAYGNGTIYKVRTDGTDWQTVLSFSGNSTTNKGAVPYGGLVSDGAGNLWGTTNQGGAGNNGTIFKCDIATGALTTVAEFTNTAGPCKGANPWATLTSDGAGNLWGTTQKGGAASLGTIFKVNVATNAVTTMVEFADLAPTKGSLPCGRLIGDGAGSFWGTTYSGGANNYGTIFKINAATGALTTLVEFTSNDVVNGGDRMKNSDATRASRGRSAAQRVSPHTSNSAVTTLIATIPACSADTVGPPIQMNGTSNHASSANRYDCP